MVLPVSIPAQSRATNSRRGRIQLLEYSNSTGYLSLYLREQLNPLRRLYAGTVWLINESACSEEQYLKKDPLSKGTYYS